MDFRVLAQIFLKRRRKGVVRKFLGIQNCVNLITNGKIKFEICQTSQFSTNKTCYANPTLPHIIRKSENPQDK